MDEIVHLINEVERKLQENKALLKNNIFIEIIEFLKNQQLFLVRNLNNWTNSSLLEKIKFNLKLINELLNNDNIETFAEIYLSIQYFLQLLGLIYNLFPNKERETIDQFTSRLRNFSIFLLDDSEKKLNKVSKSLEQEISDRKEINKKYHEQFESAKQQLQDAQDLLATTSANVLILNYEETAREEKRRARYLFWWGISVIFIGIFAVTLLFMNCFTEITQSLSWEHFLFKASIFIMFLIPAIYILKESAKRENHYFQLQDLSLKIRTIPNYLKDIPNFSANQLAEKDKVRLELAKVIFSHHMTTSNSQDNTIEELINLLRLAIKGK